MKNYYQIPRCRKIQRTEIKDALKAIFKNYLFILFSFANMFIPLYATIISSLIGPHGALNVTVVGLTTSFISIFNQFLFLMALTMIFVLHRHVMFADKERSIDKHTVSAIMFMYSFITMVLFIGSSLLYVKYSTLYQGFSESFGWAVQFVLLLGPTFIINGFVYLNVIYKLEIDKAKSITCYLIFFVLHLIMLPLFYLVIPWAPNYQLSGLGLGFLVASLLSIALVGLVNYKRQWYQDRFGVDWQTLRAFISKSGNFVWDFLLAVIMKGFLVMIIGMSLKLADKPTLPSLMIAKMLWYNSLFFCGFFGDGLFYAIEYAKMELIATGKTYHPDVKVSVILGAITFLVTLVICIIFNFAAMQLSVLYVSNETQAIEGMMPDATQVQNYLYCAQKKVISPLTGDYTTTFALGYLTIYHCFMNSFKILSVNETKINQSFSWMKVIVKFIMLTLVMSFISVCGVAFNDPAKYADYLNTFNGLDSFSFALMMISFVMFIPTCINIIFKSIKQHKSAH